jgi:hypothetical protein
MEHIVIEHHLLLLYGALKANKLAWDKLDLEIKSIKAESCIEPNKNALQDLIIRQSQIHAVVVLLTNCLIEALANFFLMNKCDEKQFAALEKLSAYEKLVEAPKQFLKKYEFPKNALCHDLEQLLALRKSLVHSKPRVFVNGQKTHVGNLAKKGQVSTLNVEKCTSLPARVVAHIWNYDRGALAELWINDDFSDSVKRENSKAKAQLKQHIAK